MENRCCEQNRGSGIPDIDKLNTLDCSAVLHIETRHNFYFIFRLLLSLFFLHAVVGHLLQAQEGDNIPETIRTKDKRYITTGTATVSAPREKADQIIENTDRWNDWMFSGMDGTEKTDRFLLVYITGVEFHDEEHMAAMVEFRFLRNLGKDPAAIPFLFSRRYGEDGALEGITAVLSGKTAILESARYEIHISGNEHTTVIAYTASVRFRGFFEFFVTLNSYKRTIEWYLQRITANFLLEISS